MHYSDIATLPLIRAATDLSSYLDTPYPVACAVVTAMREAYAAGAAGKDYVKPVASREACDLVHDAWHDGIIGRKLTVRLDSDTDGVCSECGSCVAAYDDECDDCGSEDIGRNVMVEVNAPFAEVWADWDQCIDGSSWETPSDMPNFAYTILMDHPGLVQELRKAGYELDLSNYDGEAES